MASGRVFNLQRFSVHDGPGIRTTVFLKGCPARCWWCHNPESQSPRPQVVRIEGRCLGCDACVEVCPLQMEGSGQAGTAAGCTACAACVAACPAGARQLLGREVTVPELLGEILRDRIFFEESGGGVTFSGGEPLAQPEFLIGALTACRAERLPTALDTCGFGREETLLQAAALSDLVLFDLKHTDPERHLEVTGLPLAPILDNLKALVRSHRRIWVRVPVIPGVNDDDDNLRRAIELVEGLPGICQVNLLPYHRAGSAKPLRPGESGRLQGLIPPTAARMEEIRLRFADRGLDAHVGG